MNPVYRVCSKEDLGQLARFYMDYYNAEGGSWTEELAARRLRQIMTMEDSLVVMQLEGEKLVGFLMGYFKCFDDSTGFYLEEILISGTCQNKGYGSHFLHWLQETLRQKDCQWIELLTTTGEQHQKFYGKNGFSRSENLVLEYLDL